MNAPTAGLVSEPQSSPPRFSDNLARTSSRVGSVQVAWDRGSTHGAIWLANACTIHVSTALDSPIPDAGESAELTVRLERHTFQCIVSVEHLIEVYGSFKVVCCRILPRRRRAPHRAYSVGRTHDSPYIPLYPLFCFATNPLDGRIVPLRAVDVSNGGISLVGPRSASIPLLGLEVPVPI